MQEGEILHPESLADAQGHGQGVSESQRRGGAGGGRQTQVACFLVQPDVQAAGRAAAEGGVGLAGQDDERDLQALDELQEPDELQRLAAVGQGDHHVAVRQHAQVAVDRLSRVQEQGRRAGAGERCGQLVGDDAGLAHAPGDDPAAALLQHVERLLKPLVQLVEQGEDGLGLDAEDFSGDVQAHDCPP